MSYRYRYVENFPIKKKYSECLRYIINTAIIATIFIILLLYSTTLYKCEIAIYRAPKIHISKHSDFRYTFISKEESLKLNETEVEGWSRDTNRNASDYVLPNQDAEVLKSPHVCPSEADPLLVLIIVSSTAENFEARQVVRRTWGNTTNFNYPMFQKMHGKNEGNYLDINYADWRKYAVNSRDADQSNVYDANFKVKVVFLLGISAKQRVGNEYNIIEEHEVHGDIIQESFVENYNNLTLKTIFTFKWVINNCNNRAKYIMKCDDDSFVNIPNLIHILLGGTVPVYTSTLYFAYYDNKYSTREKNRINSSTTHFIMGRYISGSRLNRNPNIGWYSPFYMMSNEVYPDYVSGIGYVVAIESVKVLYEQSLKTPIFQLEDAYMTGIVAELAGLNRTGHPLFFWSKENDCAMRGMVCLHHYKGNDTINTFNFITNPNENCNMTTVQSRTEEVHR